MTKPLGTAGSSLAKTWEVEGSQVRIEEVEDRVVHLTDEMGGRVHSERLLSHTVTISSGPIAQSTGWAVDAETLPDCVNRIFGVYVTSGATARVAHCNVNLRPRAQLANSFPIWAWDDTLDGEMDIRIMQAGSTGNRLMLVPAVGGQEKQYLMTRTGSEKLLPFLSFNGVTNAFGAGTVTLLATILLARPDTVSPGPGAPSSHGLPIPGW